MRLYCKKSGDSITFYKETLFMSIISDLFSILVILVLIGADVAFSLLVTHSFVIDLLAVVFILVYFFTDSRKVTKRTGTEECIKEFTEFAEIGYRVRYENESKKEDAP